MISLVEGAELSPCGNYRWLLARPCGGPLLDGPLLAREVGSLESEYLRIRTILWVLLNPSTADAVKNDHTIRKIIGYSKVAGAWRFLVCNLFGWRSTDPAGLLKAADPVGAMNDVWLQDALASSGKVVAAWGKGGKAAKLVERRAPLVLAQARRTHVVHALAFNDDCSPSHPLYLPGDLKPQPWEPVQ